MKDAAALAQTIRENVAHIARGCRSGLSHNPAGCEQAIEAALGRLMDALAAVRLMAERGQDAETEKIRRGTEILRLVERLETVERERDEARKWANTMEHERDWERDVVQSEMRARVEALQDAMARSLFFDDYHDWYRLRSLLLRLSEWEMGAQDKPFLSAGDLSVAGEYAARLNNIDCTELVKIARAALAGADNDA